MQDLTGTPAAPDSSEILSSLQDLLMEEGTGGFDRLTIEQATPFEYMVRVYPDRSDEYEPHRLLFENSNGASAPADAVSPTSREGV